MQEPFVRNGKTLLSGIDPVRRAERTADAVSIKDRTLYFCPSPLFGYGLERLLERLAAEAPDSAVLCVEADSELFELACNSAAPSLAQNKKLRITNICEEAALCAFVRENWGALKFRRLETIRFTGGWQLFPERYDSLCETLRREIATDWGNAMTLAKLGRLYIRNALVNLSLVPRFPSIEKLSFGESPVLVLGAGPSLDETLDSLECRFKESLRSVESRPFRIICVDTCLGALKDRNIIPDLAVVLESQHWNLRDFNGCRDWNVKAAIDFSALPASARVLGGEGFLFMTPWTQLRIFERLKDAGLLPAVIPPLGSVGLTAVEIARRTSRGKIILCGLDFSFSLDKYHARATPGHRAKLNAHTRFRGLFNISAYAASFAAVSKCGASVRTNHVMQNYRDLFEREFPQNTQLFDISGTGLPLGIKTILMEEALSLLGGDFFYHEPTRTNTNRREERREKKDFTGEDFTQRRGDAEGTSKRTPSRGVDDKNLNVPAQEESVTCDKGRLTLVSRARRGEEEIKLNNGLSQNKEKSEEQRLLTEKMLTFFEGEKKRLRELRDILTGEAAADRSRLKGLVEECDYLWGHFPDFSGGRCPVLGENSPSELSFFKRVRAEIDPMVRVMERGIFSTNR
jgi:hypothetical protein